MNELCSPRRLWFVVGSGTLRLRTRWATCGAIMVLFLVIVRTVLPMVVVSVLPSRNLSVFVLSLLHVQLLLLHAARTSMRTVGYWWATLWAVATLLTMGTCMLTSIMLGSGFFLDLSCLTLVTVRWLLFVREMTATLSIPLSTSPQLSSVHRRLLISTTPATYAIFPFRCMHAC